MFDLHAAFNVDGWIFIALLNFDEGLCGYGEVTRKARFCPPLLPPPLSLCKRQCCGVRSLWMDSTVEMTLGQQIGFRDGDWYDESLTDVCEMGRPLITGLFLNDCVGVSLL